MTRKKISLASNPLLSGPSLDDRARSGSPFRYIPLGDIDFDPAQPRRVFNEDSIGELAASIKDYGVLCPINVRIIKGGTYRLISGERRLRAAKIAGLESIPAILEPEDQAEIDILSKQLIENLQREDLTAMERALAIGQLRDRFSLSVRQIAKQLGISKSAAQRSLDVLSLPDDLQAALVAGAAESKILLLGQITNRELRLKLTARIDEFSRWQLEQLVGELGSDEATGGVSHSGTDKQRKKKGRELSVEQKRIIDDLQRSLGTKVQMIAGSKGGQGRLVIEFYSVEDLNDIYRRLTQVSP